MANWTSVSITNAGIEAEASAAANDWILDIKKAKAGSGVLVAGDDPKTFIQLKSYVEDVELIGTNTLVPTQVSCRVRVTSAMTPVQFVFNELGLYASLNNGPEFLYCYANVGIGNTGDTITDSTSPAPVENQNTIVIPYSQNANITVTLAVYPQVNLHGSTHMPDSVPPGIDPIPLAGTLPSASAGLVPKPPTTSPDQYSLIGGNPVSWAEGRFLPGFIQDYAGDTAPFGWYICDGSEKSRTVDAALFAVCGTKFGVGNGTTTFNIPDCRGRGRIAAGTGAGLTARTTGQKGGLESVGLTPGQMPAHTHAITMPAHTHTLAQTAHDHGTTQTAHTHGITQTAHDHGITQTAHGHTISSVAPAISIGQSPHAHSYVDSQVNLASIDDTHENEDGSDFVFETNFDYNINWQIGRTTGAANANISASQAAHSHVLGAANASIDVVAANANISLAAANANIDVVAANANINVNPTTIPLTVSESVGSGLGHENMAPFIVFNAIIKR
jgi:microcystin-dependent protein